MPGFPKHRLACLCRRVNARRGNIRKGRQDLQTCVDSFIEPQGLSVLLGYEVGRLIFVGVLVHGDTGEGFLCPQTIGGLR